MAMRGRPRHPDILTPREQDVLALIRDGLTNEQIAERLNIGFETAKSHVAEILSKLGVATREEAATWQGKERQGFRRWVLIPLAVASFAVLVAFAVLTWGVLRSEDATGGEIADAEPTPTPTSIINSVSTAAIQPTSVGSAVAMAPGTLSGGLYRIGIDGSNVTPIAVPADPANGAHFAYSTFSVSADGHWLAYAPRTPFHGPPGQAIQPVHVYLRDLTNASAPVDVGIFAEVGSVAVSTQGRILVSGSLGPPADPNTLSGNMYLIEARSVTPLPWLVDSYGASWSPDGTLVAAPASAGGDFQVKVGDVLGANLRTFRLSYGPIAWSPDGSFIAVGAFTGSKVGLSILDVRDGSVLHLNDIQSDMNSRISWSPDGSRVAFAAGKISIAHVEGTNSPTEELAIGIDPAWSHDGSYIAYTRDGSLYVTDVSTRAERKLGNFVQPLVGTMEWLPDDSGVLFQYAPEFVRSIRTSNADGSDERHLAYGDDPVWSPNGTMIAFVGRALSYGFWGREFVYVMNSDGSDPHEVGQSYSVSDVVGCIAGGLSWSPDGSAVVYYHPGLNEVQSAPADASSPPRAIFAGCPTSLPGTGDPFPRISPDGQHKLFLAPALPFDNVRGQ